MLCARSLCMFRIRFKNEFFVSGMQVTDSGAYMQIVQGSIADRTLHQSRESFFRGGLAIMEFGQWPVGRSSHY